MGKPLRVLMVEDCEDDALLLERALRAGGYDPYCERVDTAAGMKRALNERVWDLVLADFTLPHFSAPQALETLQQSGQDLPFIVISGTVGEDTAVLTMKAGADDYLMKGNLARLVPAVERELRDAASRREYGRAQQALRESEAQLATIFDHAPVTMLLVDRALRLRRINHAGVAISGRTRTEMLGDQLGTALGCLHSLEDARGCRFSPACKSCGITQSVLATFSSGRPQRAIEARIPLTRERRRSVLHFLVSTTLLNLGGRRMVLACLEDITDRKRAADALTQYASALEQTNRKLDRSRKELEQFVYTSSHDLRAPIVSIHGFASLLSEKSCAQLDPDQRGYIERILANARMIEALLRDLLKVSRISPDEIRAQALDVWKLAREVIADAAAESGEGRIRFICPERGPQALGHAPSLRELIRHLIDNAIKFMPERPEATIEFGYDPDVETPHGGHGAFLVRDNGDGIPSRYHKRIFQLFHRGPQAGSGAEGTGAGLTIVRRIVNAHGGQVWVSSAPGAGCTFYFSLRMNPETQLAEPDIDAGVTAPVASGGELP